MKLPLLAIAITFLVACSQSQQQEDPKIALTKKYWQALENNDVETLKQVLSEPKAADFFAGAEPGLTVESYEVLGLTEEGVNVKFVRHCYPDVIVPTVIVEKEGQPKVDFNATLKLQMEMVPYNEKTTQKYCYPFETYPLQGVINGKHWQAHHVERQAKIVAEECPEDNCASISSPRILFSNLDLSSDGGNLDYSRNITIYTPPDTNKTISTGSYRVSTTEEGKTKLELSFKDSDDFLNGYILVD